MYFHRSKLKKNIRAHLKKNFLPNCAPCIGHNRKKHRELSNKEKEELK